LADQHHYQDTYFDTSAVVPLLIAEPGSARAAPLWDGADRVVSVRLVYRRSALRSLRRATWPPHRPALRDAVTEFHSLVEEIDLIEVDDALARRAGVAD
jgi:hypothetical protein